MRVRPNVLFFLLVVAPFLSNAAPEIRKQSPQLATGSAMRQLSGEFEEARTPRADELPGTWLLTKYIVTERFVNGRNDPDHVLIDVEGIRREDEPGGPFEWILTFTVGGNGDLCARSDTVWEPSGDV